MWSILLNGCETWVLRKTDFDTIQLRIVALQKDDENQMDTETNKLNDARNVEHYFLFPMLGIGPQLNLDLNSVLRYLKRPTECDMLDVLIQGQTEGCRKTS